MKKSIKTILQVVLASMIIIGIWLCCGMLFLFLGMKACVESCKDRILKQIRSQNQRKVITKTKSMPNGIKKIIKGEKK